MTTGLREAALLQYLNLQVKLQLTVPGKMFNPLVRAKSSSMKQGSMCDFMIAEILDELKL